jgi:hypothetical protein
MREKARKTLEALARARPEALDPSRLAGSPRQQRDLVEVMSAHTTKTKRVTPRRRVLVPLVGLGAAAVVAVAAVGVGLTHNHDSQVSAAGPDGHLVLLSMANTVQNQASSGPYWQIETQSRNLSLVPASGSADGQPYVIADTSQTDWSIGVLPGEQSLQVYGINETRGPWTSLDTHRWLAAGSPETVGIDAGGKTTKGLELPVGGGAPNVQRTDSSNGIFSFGADQVSYNYLQELPADQAELAQVLNKLYRQEHHESDSDQPDWMFQQVGNLISFPVSSAVRASAYRILAGLPGITSLGMVTDPLGRTGVGVALPPQDYSDLGEEQQQLIVDPTTSTILSQQTVITQPSPLALAAGLKSGTVLDYTATMHIGWTDQPAATPTAH